MHAKQAEQFSSILGIRGCCSIEAVVLSPGAVMSDPWMKEQKHSPTDTWGCWAAVSSLLSSLPWGNRLPLQRRARFLSQEQEGEGVNMDSLDSYPMETALGSGLEIPSSPQMFNQSCSR